MANETLQEEYFVEYKIAKGIWTYVPPIIILTGTMTNILATVVLLRRKFRNSTTMFYLTVLSVGDNVVLYAGLLWYWIRNSFDTDPLTNSQFSCKLIKFLVYFSTDFCNWLLVAVTFDRCILICFPYKCNKICSKSSAKKIVVGIGIAMFVINFHLFWGYSVTENNGERLCEESNHFTKYVFTWIDLCLYSVFPFTIMFICNSLIVRQMVSSKRKVMSHNSDETRNTGLANDQKKQIAGVTIMLRTINVAFFVLTMPIVVFGLYAPYHTSQSVSYETSVVKLFEAIVTMLEFLNNSVHFFLYCLTGKEFRRELQAMFKSGKTPTLSEDTARTKY